MSEKNIRFKKSLFFYGSRVDTQSLTFLGKKRWLEVDSVVKKDDATRLRWDVKWDFLKNIFLFHSLCVSCGGLLLSWKWSKLLTLTKNITRNRRRYPDTVVPARYSPREGTIFFAWRKYKKIHSSDCEEKFNSRPLRNHPFSRALRSFSLDLIVDVIFKRGVRKSMLHYFIPNTKFLFSRKM